MIKCVNCDNVLSDGYIIKATAVIQIDYQSQLVNIKCRRCKQWNEKIPLDKLIRTELVRKA